MSDKGTARHGAHEFSENWHVWHWFPPILFLRDVQEFREVLVVNLLLARQISLEGLAGKKAIQSFAIVHVSSSIKENPVRWAKKLLGDIYHAWLDKSRRVEYFASHVP